MKIESVMRSDSDERQTAFKTDPPLSAEVFECALKNYLGMDKTSIYSVEDGLFIVARTAIGADQVKIFEDALTNAEKQLNGIETRAEGEREGLLQERAKKAGLPLD